MSTPCVILKDSNFFKLTLSRPNSKMRSFMKFIKSPVLYLSLLLNAFLFGAIGTAAEPLNQNDDQKVTRVFIFAGQSNMVGSDSRVKDIQRFPPFAGLEKAQNKVLFSYSIGRENKTNSNGWTKLEAVNQTVGPELSFARKVSANIDAPIAIIKCAAGGTHLGGDWNPDEPIGFKMYPLALSLIRDSLAKLDEKGIPYRIEGFMWHQGENDMFVKEYMPNYGKNLKNFLAKWRRDLKTPKLKFYIGELCTKTIWGMDLRPRMYAISLGQKEVTAADDLAEYVPTSHVGVEIGGGVGLHYHYGTLGQLEHGVNYADAYLRTIGKAQPKTEPIKKWPFDKKSKVKLFVMAGHRNMEGERAFTQELQKNDNYNSLMANNENVPYKYSIGGDYLTSNGWESMRPAGYYDTFGPEVSFANMINKKMDDNIAIAKFTHSGSQIIDWTPQGSEAKSRNLYPKFLKFIQQSKSELESKGHQVELAGIFYHVGENDMSFHPFRKNAAKRVAETIGQLREDLRMPELKWFVSQQPPTDHKNVNSIDVLADFKKIADADPNFYHITELNLPQQEKQLVIDTAGILTLGDVLAKRYIETAK